MANSNEESKKTLEKPQKPVSKKSSSLNKNSKIITVGAFVLALSALGVASYTLSLNQQLREQLLDHQHELSIQLNKLEQKQDNTEGQIDAKISNFEEVKSNLHVKIDELSKQLQAAMSQKFYQQQNWLLLKVRYYMELAQINAHWSKNFDVTASLLHHADELLQQLNGPKIFNIRQAIAQDIARVKAIPTLDVVGILSQLNAAQTSLDNLTIPSTLNEIKPAANESKEFTQEHISVWRLRLQDSMKLLNKLIVIRRNDEDVKPLISPAMEALLKESIHLNLQEAQWAVLNNNNEVYHLVLKQAIDALKKNFNENAQNTAALIKKLSDLHQIELIQERPEINSALPLLNQIIDSKELTIKNENQEGDSL